MRKPRRRKRSLLLKVTDPRCDNDKDHHAAFPRHAVTLHSGRPSRLQCMTHNLQGGDCGECSSADRPTLRRRRAAGGCFPVSHCLRPSRVEVEGQERLSSNKHSVPASLARPDAGDNTRSNKGPALLELTVWEGVGGEISNHGDVKRRVIQRISKGNLSQGT